MVNLQIKVKTILQLGWYTVIQKFTRTALSSHQNNCLFNALQAFFGLFSLNYLMVLIYEAKYIFRDNEEEMVVLRLKKFQHYMVKFDKLIRKIGLYQDDFLAGLSAFLNLSE